MKKIIAIIALLALCAAPAVADSIVFNFVPEGDLASISIWHKAFPADYSGTADEFIAYGGFTESVLGNTSPQTFTLEYPEGTEFAFWGEAVSAEGDRTVIMRNDGGTMTPIVWVGTDMAAIGNATYVVLVPEGSVPHVKDPSAKQEVE